MTIELLFATLASEPDKPGEAMAHVCYVSFKTEDEIYKKEIQGLHGIELIDRSLDEPIDSADPDYIMRRIRSEYLSSSTVTIHLIGAFSAENRGWDEQQFIKRELQASLYNGDGNTRNGILGVVLPEAADGIYRGAYQCAGCGASIQHIAIDDGTTVREFSRNYYIANGKCHWTEDDRYCVMVTWAEFMADPTAAIERAFAKREAPIASKVTVYP